MIQKCHEEQTFDDALRMIGDDDGWPTGWNPLPIAVVYLEMDVQNIQQALRETGFGSVAACEVEAVRHLGRNQQTP